MNNRKSNHFVKFLFLLYLLLLVWIILFKLSFSLSELDRIREINIIPFYYEHEVTFHATEVVENVLIFIPFGVYLCMLKKPSMFAAKLLVIAGTSAVFEMLQFILAVGRTDITDLITNTCGGVLGILLYNGIIKVAPNEERINKIITVAAAIVTFIVGGGLIFLILVN